MELLAIGLSGFVVVAHVGFMVLEMFLWTTPFGLKTFGRTAQQAEDSKVLAANQGLYNGLLAALLVVALIQASMPMRLAVLACVVVAGVYGAATAKKSILFIQALPAALAIGASLAS